jgi:hypothetical protein
MRARARTRLALRLLRRDARRAQLLPQLSLPVARAQVGCQVL